MVSNQIILFDKGTTSARSNRIQHVTGVFFYPKESIVSISSQFQFSGLRMSSVDPLSGQVPSEV